MTTAFIGLGSNLGDRLGNVADAVDAISQFPETHVEKVSHAYESVPAFVEDQPNFINAVIEVETSLHADALLERLLELETSMGRVRDIDKGPRTIDLDLLIYGDEEWASEKLTLPHPGIAERDFVVTPLLEIAPRTVLPDGVHLRRSAANVGEVLHDLGPLPDSGADHNRPVDADAWTVVAETTNPQDASIGFDAGLLFKRQVLEDEGIPFAFDPYEPGQDLDPFGMQMSFKLLVPSEYAERAIELLAAVAAAEPQYPEGMS